MKKIVSAMLLIVALMALAACGGEAATTAPATTAPATGGGTTGGAAALNFDSGQAAENIYVPATAEATAGEVTVTFNNVSAQPHNWTLVKVGEEDTATTEALKDPTNYSYAGAIAQTKLLQAGAGKDTVTFTAQPGTYTYLCTFPGHYTLGMKGTLTVK